MAKVREGLEKSKREREQQEGWFESWFNYSPWLTTLLSAITGPLLLLIIILTVGPCVINKLVTFVKDRINRVQLMVLRTQYRPLDEQEL